MDKQFNTLEDFDFRDKTVLLRVDINCPLDKKTLKIVNDARIRRIVPTVRELVGKRARLVILAHQSRKGGWDFIPLEQHAELLSRHLCIPVKYVDDVIGKKAVEAVKELEPGQVLLLGNVRELDSETAKGDMDMHAKGEIVTTLAPLIDYYVCDAFGASHRSQCSLVGFEARVPSASGRLMAKELYALDAIFGDPRRPSVFILGGAKFGDVSEMIDRVLGSGMADTVILVGLVGNAYLLARGVDIGEASSRILQDELTPENLQGRRRREGREARLREHRRSPHGGARSGHRRRLRGEVPQGAPLVEDLFHVRSGRHDREGGLRGGNPRDHDRHGRQRRAVRHRRRPHGRSGGEVRPRRQVLLREHGRRRAGDVPPRQAPAGHRGAQALEERVRQAVTSTNNI